MVTVLRAVVLILGLLALAGGERGPDAERLADDIEVRLTAAFYTGLLDLAWLRRAGSAPEGAATLVYFDTEIDVCPGHDFSDWRSPGLGALGATAGAAENLRLLRAGEADLTLVQSDIAALALDGRGLVARERPMPNLQALAALHPEHVQLVAMVGSEIRSVPELAGRRVNLGPFRFGFADERAGGALGA